MSVTKPVDLKKQLEACSLTDRHVADLERSGITREQAMAAGIRSVSDSAIISRILGWDKPAKNLGSCMMFTFRDLEGKLIPDYARLRPDHPRRSNKTDDKGKVIKYESPREKSNRAYFPLAALPALKEPQSAILITEGEKKALRATLAGFPTIGLVGVWGWVKKRSKNDDGSPIGARELIDDLASILWQGRHVWIVFDSDAVRKWSVQSAERNLAEALMKLGAIVKIIRLPDGPLGSDGLATKVGLDDYLGQNTPDDLRDLIEKMDVLSAETIAVNVGAIMIGPDEKRVSDAVLEQLAHDPELYQSAGCLVRVLREPESKLPGLHLPAAPRIDPIPLPALRERIADACHFVAPNPYGWLKEKHPPAWSVAAIHARGSWPNLRTLQGVVSFPMIRPDGTLLGSPGYDRATRLYLDWPFPPLPLNNNPTLADAKAASEELLDIVSDFPFLSPVHRSAWLAGLLTPLARAAIDGPTPLFLVDANVRGSGKGKLLDVIANIILGTNMVVATYPRDEDELRKKITSCLVRGDRLVVLDNLTGNFGNGTLDALLTSTMWRDRILGESRMYDGPAHTTWYGTGNNVQIGADTSRRTCHMRLESGVEKPEERTGFKYPDLLGFIRRHRSRLLVAALTILRAYFVAGKPDMKLPAWGSYEAWSAIVRNALVWIGQPDLGETRVLIQEKSDTTAAAMNSLLEALEMADPDRLGLTTAEIIDLATQEHSSTSKEVREMIREALVELVPKLEAQRLSFKFRSLKRRLFGANFLDEVSKTRKGSVRWSAFPASDFNGKSAGTSPASPASPADDMQSMQAMQGMFQPAVNKNPDYEVF